MVEDEVEYKVNLKINCKICGTKTNKNLCSDCIELEEKFNLLKNTSEEKAKQWLKKQLKELKD